MNTDAGSLTIALLTACTEPDLGIRSSIVQQLLDEASEDQRLAREVITTMLTASVMSLRAYSDATQRDPQDVLRTLGVSWSRRSLTA
ncbi:hypothetical protein LEP48_13060 [Isoptericola sp. NEAU-Y5]|uniref:TetR family transcriptional regulator n=1 Tax=Isoptericola luteus TaxID=2879484 RepID=A0ABS7ZGV9_9MICO|nr:hypothetical protein [Isoptericola sp. NEAU-Y5]MCA5894271.1 hypothetical protein [Isoptericola sp. NEAU-Y5]